MCKFHKGILIGNYTYPPNFIQFAALRIRFILIRIQLWIRPYIEKIREAEIKRIRIHNTDSLHRKYLKSHLIYIMVSIGVSTYLSAGSSAPMDDSFLWINIW